jgi:sugar/nucleoside kinase (ribokinase family)
MSLLVVGSVGIDSVETPFGSRDELLGGAATYCSVAASFFGPVRMVGVVGEDFPKEHVEMLTSRGIDLAGLERVPGKTFRWKGRYSFDLNHRDTIYTHLNVFADFRPKIPASYRDSEFVFLGNIDPELQLSVLDQVKAPRFVGLDTMNYWIESKLETLRKVLKRIDLLFVNDAEARQLAQEQNVFVAARKILAMGPKALVIKRGEYGALSFAGGQIFSASAYPLEQVFDPTGAGDTFAGGFMGYLAGNGDPSAAVLRRAMVTGSVLASFAVEQFSLDRLQTLQPAEIQARYKQFKQLTHFEDLEVDLAQGKRPS